LSARRGTDGEVVPRPMTRSKSRLGTRTRPHGGLRTERQLGGEHGRGRRKARGKARSKGTAASTGRLGRSTARLQGCSRESARGARPSGDARVHRHDGGARHGKARRVACAYEFAHPGVGMARP
jgi:hypothetical protein